MRRGFTLIELLAAMAILAVVSVMAVQALGGVFHQRAVLTRIDDSAAGVIRALALLRQDLQALVPLPESHRDGQTPVNGLLVGVDGIVLMRGGIEDLPGAPSDGLALVRWRLDGDALLRIEQRRLGDAAVSETRLLEGVVALALAPLGLDPGGEADPAALAPGYELRIETRDRALLRLVVAR